ncbi:MAG: hypothetical protein C9356_11600 [Oleiphilus sp.]|nr:MAG: hypothetical protein C9356_11600 [Oleiphilus sp.]
MVLTFKNQKITAFVILLSLLGACSSVKQRQVVAVNSVDSGAPATTTSDAPLSVPLPPVVTSLLQQAERDIDAGLYQQAEKRLQQAQRIVPAEPRVYLVWGHWAQARQRPYQAEQMYRRVLSLSSRGTSAHAAARRALEAMDIHREY